MCEKIDYMRVSVTDRCNLRCSYCMPKQGLCAHPVDKLLTFEEILRLVKIVASLGVRKIRLTGGEPLMRKNIVELVSQISKVPGIEKTCITTNGVLLSRYAEDLKKAGINEINLSLDSLKKETFKFITGNDCFSQVMEGIKKIKQLNFDSIKLNMVVMKGINDSEIIDFMNFALKEEVILRFIEFMKVTPLWEEKLCLPMNEIKKICEKEFELERIHFKGSGPAEYYKMGKSRVGFIRTDVGNCNQCSRLRLTAVGKLKICLYEKGAIDLQHYLRNDCSDEQIKDIIKEKIELKNDVSYKDWENSKVFMSSVGG